MTGWGDSEYGTATRPIFKKKNEGNLTQRGQKQPRPKKGKVANRPLYPGKKTDCEVNKNDWGGALEQWRRKKEKGEPGYKKTKNSRTRARKTELNIWGSKKTRLQGPAGRRKSEKQSKPHRRGKSETAGRRQNGKYFDRVVWLRRKNSRGTKRGHYSMKKDDWKEETNSGGEPGGPVRSR